MRIFLRLLPLLVTVLLWGCFRVQYPAQPAIPVSDFVKKVRLPGEAILSIRGLARIEVISRTRRFNAREFIALVKPRMIRLDTMTFLDQPLFLFVSRDGVSFQAMSLSENRFYEGTVANGFSRLIPLGIGVDSQEFISILLGEIPSHDEASIQYDQRKQLYRLSFPPSSRWQEQIYWVHPGSFRVVEVSKKTYPKGDEIHVFFRNFKETGNTTFPMQIEIEVPAADIRTQIAFRQIEVNPTLPPDLFSLSIPQGAEIVRMD